MIQIHAKKLFSHHTTTMNSTFEDLRLLARATTPFLDLSLFFSESNNPEAVKAREKWPPRKPFYTYLYQELKELTDVLQDLNEVTPGSDKAIRTLLKHFERNLSRSLLQNLVRDQHSFLLFT